MEKYSGVPRERLAAGYTNAKIGDRVKPRAVPTLGGTLRLYSRLPMGVHRGGRHEIDISEFGQALEEFEKRTSAAQVPQGLEGTVVGIVDHDDPDKAPWWKYFIVAWDGDKPALIGKGRPAGFSAAGGYQLDPA